MHACDKLHEEHQQARDRLDFLLFVGAINPELGGWFHAVMDGLVDAADTGLMVVWDEPAPKPPRPRTRRPVVRRQ